MNPDSMRARLRRGQKVYGSMITAVSPMWPGAAKGASLDFAFLDTEHVAQSRAQLSWMCRLYAQSGVTPIVRIPSPDPYQAAMVLDGGAQGVIAPYLEGVEQVRELVGAVRYRPLKGAKLQAALRGETPLEPQLQTYLDRRNADNVAIANIESQAAIDALDDLLAVDGLDAVLIGPHDLSCNLGIPEDYFNPRFEAAVETIITKARARGLGAGIHIVYGGGIEQEIRWARLGANLIVHSMDIVAFRNGLRAEIAQIKAAVEGSASDGDLEEIAL